MGEIAGSMFAQGGDQVADAHLTESGFRKEPICSEMSESKRTVPGVPKDFDAFMAERLRIYRKRHGRSPRRLVHWCAGHTSGVRRLLRGAQEQWPPPSSGDSDLQRFEAHLMQRGLTPDYVKICRSHRLGSIPPRSSILSANAVFRPLPPWSQNRTQRARVKPR